MFFGKLAHPIQSCSYYYEVRYHLADFQYQVTLCSIQRKAYWTDVSPVCKFVKIQIAFAYFANNQSSRLDFFRYVKPLQTLD